MKNRLSVPNKQWTMTALAVAVSVISTAQIIPISPEDQRGLGLNDPMGTAADLGSGTYARYGNWLGPGWWGGSELDHRCGILPPVDSLDELAQRHDMAYLVAEKQGKIHGKSEEQRLKALADYIAHRDASKLDPDPTKWARPPQNIEEASRYRNRMITTFKYEQHGYQAASYFSESKKSSAQKISDADALDKAVSGEIHTWQKDVDAYQKKKEELKKKDDKKPDDKKPDDKKPDDKKPDDKKPDEKKSDDKKIDEKKPDDIKTDVQKKTKVKKKPVPPKKPDAPKKIPVEKKPVIEKKSAPEKTPDVPSGETIVPGGFVSDKNGKITVTYTQDKNGNNIKTTYTTTDINGKVTEVKTYGPDGKLIPDAAAATSAAAQQAAKTATKEAAKNASRPPAVRVMPGGCTCP